MISKTLPVYSQVKARNAMYHIDDMFFRFWFRFVFKKQEYIELERFDELRALVNRDFDTFSGYALERYFYQKFAEESHFTRIGSWWERKGENEIDLVCDDELAGELQFFEVKRDRERYDAELLKKKVVSFLNKQPELNTRKMKSGCLSLDVM